MLACGNHDALYAAVDLHSLHDLPQQLLFSLIQAWEDPLQVLVKSRAAALPALPA